LVRTIAVMERTLEFTVVTEAIPLVAVGLDEAAASLPCLALTLACGLAGFVWPLRSVRRLARQRRREMDAALASFLDVVNVLLAGGSGVETALLAGAEISGTWPFVALRSALGRAAMGGSTFWDELADLGLRVGSRPLVEVANSVKLAGEHGARVRASLAAKASSLRTRQLAEIEHQAHESTEQMGLPMVLMFLGFVVLLGYPAYVGTLSAL
jgi:Flp pilus assembly protein TadB